MKNSIRTLARCAVASSSISWRSSRREQRLRLLRVADHRDDDVVEVPGGALDDVEVAVGDGIERARAEGGRHAVLLSVGTAGRRLRRSRRPGAYRRRRAPSRYASRRAASSGVAPLGSLDARRSRPARASRGAAERVEHRGDLGRRRRRTAGRGTRGRTGASGGGGARGTRADRRPHDTRRTVGEAGGREVGADRVERGAVAVDEHRARRAPRQRLDRRARRCPRRGRARPRRRARRASRAREHRLAHDVLGRADVVARRARRAGGHATAARDHPQTRGAAPSALEEELDGVAEEVLDLFAQLRVRARGRGRRRGSPRRRRAPRSRSLVAAGCARA